MDFLKKLFILIIFLFPLGEIIRVDFGYGVVIKPFDIGIAIFFLSWLLAKFSKKQEIGQKKIILPVALFVFSGLLSLIINNFNLSLKEWLISLSYLLRWAAGVSIFFAVNGFDGEFKRRISKVLIAVGSLVIGLGYIQYFFYSDLHSLFYLGWDEHKYRMFSTFLDPNFAGAFFVLFFLFLVNMFLKEKNILVGLLSILTLGAIFLTFSRSALIMLIVSSSLLFILMKKKVWIGLLLGIVILVLAVSSRYSNIENINLLRIVSSEARLETARNAIKIIQDNPIFGVGFNAYRYAQFRYGFRNELNAESHADASPDNSFLFVMATTGLLGFAFFVFLWFRILKNNIKNTSLVLPSVVGVFVNSLFINSLFYVYVIFWLWTIIGLNSSGKSNPKENK